MNATVDILDTVLLNLRIEEGKFLADLGGDVVRVDHLLKDSKGNVWAHYYAPDTGELTTVLKYNAEWIPKRTRF